ncbi:RimK family alpha-L-glutamate ligase [Micromonospora sp. NPDC049102]|uniref:RimK family alpha-L-glutamate ligase n=1 Tax=Micromonospora sp. NPDC049102 TaxID=3364265 RepID=UPI003711012C
MSEPASVAVLTSRLRVDDKRILEALDRRNVAVAHVDTRTAWWPLDGGTPEWRLVLNREIGQIRAGYAARALERLGVIGVNSASAIETCADKWHTSIALRAAGLPTPRTALAATPEAALSALAAIGYPAVVKPLVGSWGRLVTTVPDPDLARTVLEYVAALPGPQAHIVYVQEYVRKPDRDIRVVVVGGEVLGAVYRYSADWRTNVARGARTERCALTDRIVELATTAAAAVGADLAGVDLVEDETGRLYVLEVNSGVEFAGFEQAYGGAVDVAGRIVDHVLARLA